MRFFVLSVLILEVIGKRCQGQELGNSTISNTLEVFQNRIVNISKYVECTDEWLLDRKIYNSVELDTKALASRLDSDLKGFGAISLALQGIPILINRYLWELNSFSGYSLNGNSIKEIIKKSGSIPIVVDETSSSVLIRDSLRSKEVLLGMVSEDTLSFINSCLGLLCLQVSSPELMSSPLLDFKPKIGLISSNLEDLVLAYQALLIVPYKSVKHIKRYENYDVLKNLQIAIIPVNSSEWYQPCFGPIANRLHQLKFYMRSIILEGVGVTDGVFSFKEALDSVKMNPRPTKDPDFKNYVIRDPPDQEDIKRDIYKDMLSGNQLEILAKPSVLKGNHYHQSHNQLWKRDTSRKILSRLVDPQLHEFIITPSHHHELIKLIEYTNYPTLTLASQYFNESMTIVSLHSNNNHLVHMAKTLLSF